MELHDPALVVFFFFSTGDRGSEHLWAHVTASTPKGHLDARRERFTLDGSTVVQAVLERAGSWGEEIWQDLSQTMTRWVGDFVQSPPGRPWGISWVLLGAAVTDLYEEERLLRRQMAMPDIPSRSVTTLPSGRLWLLTPPAMTEGGPLRATYAWIYAPSKETRAQLQDQLWQRGALFQRAELYLHRALHQVRQYGREERAAFWAAMEQTETAAASALIEPANVQRRDVLRRAGGTVVQGLARLSRRHNLLRSSGHLYRRLGSELRQEEGGLFPWFEDRLKEALQQWGYDLERADRAVTLCHTALLVASYPGQPARWRGEPGILGGEPDSLRWPLYVIAAAAVALCLVDDSWGIVTARLGVLLVLSLLWGWWHHRRRRQGGASA